MVKAAGVLVAIAGILVLALAAAPSVAGQPSGVEAQERDDQAPPPGRDLTILAGRGAEIGVSIREVGPADKARAGVVVEHVRPDSPAEKAGLRRADVIVEFDGEAVRSVRQFTRLVQETAPGKTVRVDIVRDGSRRQLDVTPVGGRDSVVIDSDRLRERIGEAWRRYQELPPFNFDFDFSFPYDGRGRLGVAVQELTSQLATYFGVHEGLLITSVTDDAPGARAGLKAGDVITKVNGAPVRTRADLVHELRDSKNSDDVTVTIVRDKKESTVTVKLEAHPRSGRPAEATM
jgi:serine protease Do